MRDAKRLRDASAILEIRRLQTLGAQQILSATQRRVKHACSELEFEDKRLRVLESEWSSYLTSGSLDLGSMQFHADALAAADFSCRQMQVQVETVRKDEELLERSLKVCSAREEQARKLQQKMSRQRDKKVEEEMACAQEDRITWKWAQS